MTVFSAGTALAAPGFGLRGMRERVELLGGTFAAGATAAGRWAAEATVPLDWLPA
ncbi:hypothetical protein [Xylanimonas sp. McL0601]|uniref:hypothetical protein n=1 Tax=Xylanimonas sp. McL0601 TaxID=3414739 RepID=UPI003CE8EFF4